jgi:hypothetical protein
VISSGIGVCIAGSLHNQWSKNSVSVQLIGTKQ